MAKNKTGAKAQPATSAAQFKSIYDYANWLKSQIKIHELFTELTGEKFVKLPGDARLRAKVPWRDDNTPSLCLYEPSNTLTDFASKSNYLNKNGEIINHTDLLLKLKQVTTFYGAVEWLANKLGEQVPADIKKTSGKYENLNKVLNLTFVACLENAKRFLEDPNNDKFKEVRAFCEKRKIPLNQALWSELNIGIWPNQPEIATIVDDAGIKLTKTGKQEKTDEKKPDLGLTDIPRIHDNAAIVFPLHDNNGFLTGLALRPTTSKYMLKAQINDNGAYGMLDILNEAKKNPDELFYIVEGQFNKVQLGAHSFREFGESDFGKFLVPTLSTGSKHFNLDKIKKYIKNVCYFADNDIGSGHDKSYLETVVDVYNQVQAEQFFTVFWENKTDHYDIDDFLRENLTLKTEELKKQLKIVNIIDFVVLAINDIVAGIQDPKQRNSAKYVQSTLIVPRLYNPADRAELNKVFSFQEDDLDRSFQATYNREQERDLGDGLKAHKNRYILSIPDPNGGPDKEIEISQFILEMKQRVVKKETVKAGLREAEHSAHELTNYDCYLYHANGKRTDAVFKAQDFSDSKNFITSLAKVDMDARASIVVDNEKQLFQAILKSIDTKNELLQYTIPGPHLASTSPEAIRSTLRPGKWDFNLKTFLNRGFSVINGVIQPNKSIDIEFVNNNSLEFAIYSDEEHEATSKMLWEDFRSIQQKQMVSAFLGFTFCVPFKHLLNDNINGMSCVLVGGTKTGKTSLALMCQNFYGTILSDAALLNFHCTPLAFERMLTRLGTTLAVCDEYRPNPSFSTKDLSIVFHNAYAGKTKERLTQNSESMGTEMYTGNYVFTGEQIGKMQSSTEARHLQFDFKEEDKTTEEHYVRVRSNLSKLKCFMPRLIAWQHGNIEKISQFYKSRKKQLLELHKDTQQGSRLAQQIATIDSGFFSFVEMLKQQGTIDSTEAENDFLEYITWSNDFSEKNVYRAEESQHHTIFMKSLYDIINTNAVNMVIMKEDGQSTRVDKYTHDSRKQVLIMKFMKHKTWHYALLSFELILNEINKMFHSRDFTFEHSILRELSARKIIKLSPKNQIESTKIPDLLDPTKLKSVRAVVISEAKLMEFENV